VKAPRSPGLHAYLAEPVPGRRILQRCDDLARHSEPSDGVTRLYLSRQHRDAARTLEKWMSEAGMDVRLDEAGNVIGRYHSAAGAGPYLITGSHQDSVRQGGRYDGPLGVIAAIDCVAVLCGRGKRFPFGIEVVAFGDEEGTRFKTTLAGSRALAGCFDDDLLNVRDADGISMRDALIAFGLEPGAIGKAAHTPSDVLAYIELHIEQGPVLEEQDLPVCVVSAISGQSRSMIRLTGTPNHAGTVPMALRHDPLLAASEIALAIERTAAAHEHTVGTVGEIEVEPGVINVIPGLVRMTLDLRSQSDDTRKAAYSQVLAAVDEIACRRGVGAEVESLLDLGSCPCAPWLIEQLESAVRRNGVRAMRLPSGAGHDGMAMSKLTDIGMIFVRCKAGISHSPAESVSAEDVTVGANTLLNLIENFEPRRDELAERAGRA
jgi:allantoate deiminase